MAAGPGEFIKQNLKAPGLVGGAIIGATAIAGLAQGESKLKTIATALKDVVLWTASWNLMLSRLFVSFGSGIRSVLAGTGSIEAALKKLSSMQDLQKVFTPLAGGAEAAKVKVAALVNLAASKHLSFENVANAAKNMHILSDGAAGSVEDLNRLASVSKVTGISIGELGNAVGSLSIDSLKNMGAISATAAASLEQLRQNGGSTSQVMNQLASELDAVAASGKGSEASLAGVEAKYASVVEQMKTAVGSPWIKGDVQNTKNYADALQAVTPALKEVSSAFYVVFGGLATAKSEIVKWIAQSDIAKDAIKGLAFVIGGLVTVLSVVGGVKLAFWLGGAAQAFKNVAGMASTAGLSIQRWTGSVMMANAAARATTIGVTLLNYALKAMGIVTILSMLASLYGMYKNWSSASDEVAKETQGVADSTRQMSEALQEQIDKIDSIVTRQAALQAALKESTDAWAAYHVAVAAGKDPGTIANLKEKAEAADAKAKNAAAHPIGRDAAIVAREDADAEARKRSEYERAMQTATPEEKKELMSAEGERRSSLGRRGAQESKRNEKAKVEQSEIDVKIALEEQEAKKKEMARSAEINQLETKIATGDFREWIKDTEGGATSVFSYEKEREAKKRRDDLVAQGPIEADTDKLEADKFEAGVKGGMTSEAEAHLRLIAKSENVKTRDSSGMYSDMSDEDKLAAKEKWNRQKAEAERLQESHLQNEQSGAELKQQSGMAGEAISLDDQIAAVHQRIADSKETGYNLTLQELAAQQEILAIESLKKGLSNADKEGKVEKIKLIQKQIDAASRARDAEMRDVAASRATSAITGAGYGVDRQKAGIERQRLVAERDAATTKEAWHKADAGVRAHDAGEREAGVAGFQKGRDIRSELERSSAMARGDSASLTRLNNFDEFKGNFDRLRADLGTDKAAEVAGKLSRDAITLRARNDMNSSNAGVVGASMARIGGGGGIGPGATSMIDIQKQIKDLSQEGNVLLKEIRDLEKIKRGIPAN